MLFSQIESFLSLFQAREDNRSSWHVYVAAALMEYYCTKDRKIAANVFELGFKKFKDNEDYILAYIDYLSHQNGNYEPKSETVSGFLISQYFFFSRGQQYSSTF